MQDCREFWTMMDDDIRLLKKIGVMTDDFFYNILSKKV